MGRKNKDTICWGCKRALNSPECTCSWARDGVPVKGWEAEKGDIFLVSIGEGANKRKPAQSYIVSSCPLYTRYKKYLTLDDVIETLMNYFQCKRNSIYTNFKRKINQYERETGEKFPLWVKYHFKDNRFNL